MEKVILKEKVSGDTRSSNKRYYKNKKQKNKVDNTDNFNKKYDDMVLRSGEVWNISYYQKKTAGSYMIGNNTFIYLKDKPNFIHRYFTKLLLGWSWKDAK
jgi:hypothetical protein